MAEEAQAFYGGPVGILVNNAGYFYDVSPLIRMSDEQINHTIDVNLKGTMYMSREICRRLTDAGLPGRVVNITSGAAHSGRVDFSNYCASKAMRVRRRSGPISSRASFCGGLGVPGISRVWYVFL